MESKSFPNAYVLRIDPGEEVVQTILDFAKAKGVKLASVSGIGAADPIVIGLFETSSKQYHSRELVGDHEITSLLGNITTMAGETYLHLHATLGDSENKVYGGHLNSAIVSATCEVFIHVVDGEVDRYRDESVGLNLLKLE